MAIEKIINIKVDASQATTSLNQTEQELNKVGTASSKAATDINKTNKSLKDITSSSDDVGKKLKDLDAVVATTPKNFKELGKQITAYQTIALQAGRESAVGQEALRNAAKLKDQMVDLQNETKRLADDNKMLQGALGIGTGVLAGFTAYQGMLGLTGVESEELQKTMVKLQATQSALSGVIQLQTAFQKESAAMTAINTIGTKAYAVAQTVLNFATGAGTKAMKIFRIALISTGIGALVVGVGLLIANFDKVVDAVKNVRDRFNGMGEGFKTVISIIFPFIGIIRLISAGLEALGITENQQERDRRKAAENELARNREAQAALDKKLKDLGKEKDELGKKHSFEERLMKAQGASEEEIFQAIRKNRLERIKASEEFAKQTKIKSDLLVAEYKLLQASGDLTKEEADRINAAIKENNKIIVDSNNERRALNEDIRLDDEAKTTSSENKKTDAAKAAGEKRRANEKTNADKIAADKKAAEEKEAADLKALKETLAGIEKDYQNTLLSQQQLELNAVTDKYAAIREAAIKNKQDITNLDLLQAQEQKVINDKFLKEKTDQQVAAQSELQQQLFDLQAESVQKTLDQLDLTKEAELLKLQEKLTAKLITQEQFEQANTAVVANFATQTDKVKKDANDADLAREQELQNKKLELTSAAFGVIGDLINAFAGESEASQRKAFEITKAVNLGQAITNTALAVTAALTAGGNPIKLATGTQFVEAGFAAAAGAVQIATIARTKFQGGGSPPPPPGLTDPTTATSQPAQFNVVGNTGTNQLADSLGANPIKAFVVSGDVTTAQSLERNKIQQSTL